MTGEQYSDGERLKKYHKASFMDDAGNMSALCFSRPRKINLRSANWTTNWEAVTCPACLALRPWETA